MKEENKKEQIKRYLLLRFNKIELDFLSSVFGLISTISIVLVSNQVGNKQIISTIGGISGAIISILINKPASISPSTEEIETKLTEENKE